MKTALVLAASIFAFTLVESPNPVYINGNLIGNAQNIRGIIAVSVQDLARAIGGTTNLQVVGLRIQGNKLSTFLPAVQSQALGSPWGAQGAAGQSHAVTSPRDPASGLPTGQRMHKPFTITKEMDISSSMLTINGKSFVPLADVAKAFGGTLTLNGNLRPGQTINLNFAHSPGAALSVGQ